MVHIWLLSISMLKGLGKIMEGKPFWAPFPALHDNTLAMQLLVVTTPPVARPLVVQTQAVPTAQERMSQRKALSCHYLTNPFWPGCLMVLVSPAQANNTYMYRNNRRLHFLGRVCLTSAHTATFQGKVTLWKDSFTTAAQMTFFPCTVSDRIGAITPPKITKPLPSRVN